MRRSRTNGPRLRFEAARASGAAGAFVPEPFKLTHQDLHALRREEHTRVRDHWIKDPPTGFRRLRITAQDEETLQLDALELLESGGYQASMENIERLVPLLVKARREAAQDVEHARVGEYEKIADLTKIPERTTPALDFVAAFEEYAAKGGLKGGSAGRTASRWRPKVKEFCDFVRHRDLKRIKTSDGYDWVDRLIEKKIPRDSIRKVWLAALSATASFMVERRKLDQNPFLGIRVPRRGRLRERRKGAAAERAASERLHVARGQAHPDGHLGGPERFHFGRDGRGPPLAAVAMRL